MQKSGKYLLFILGVSLLLAFSLMGTAAAKSLYVCSNTNSSAAPIQAYDINPIDGSLTFQATYNTNFGRGSVGLAIDTDSGYLFLTREGQGHITLIDGATMTGAGTISAPGARNLAGIVYDHDKGKVYAVNRYGSSVYVYSWDPSGPTLTLDSQPSLAGCSAYGIALDETNDLLYVASSNQTIRVFNTSDWSSAGTYSVTPSAVSVAVDSARGFLYTCGWGQYTLSKIDLSTGGETTSATSQGTVGLGVDLATGVLYVTHSTGGDSLRAYDTTTSPFILIDTTGDIGDPTGIAIPIEEFAYNPLNLSKEDNPDPVTPGGQIAYTICFDNLNNPDVAVNDVEIADDIPNNTTLVSYQVIFEPPGGTTISDDGTMVTWDVGTVAGGAESYCMEMIVQVDPNFGGDLITNDAYIYWSIAGQPSSTHVTETTDVISQPWQACDVNNDGAIDIDDIREIGAHRGTTNPLYDIDGDGVVTTNDARQCVLDCDNPRCTISSP